MAKISQYAGSVPSDHGQRQALVEPLSFPGVARHVNEFLCKTAQERGSGLAKHTIDFDCNYMQLVESNNCDGGHCVSSICQYQHQLLHCLV